MGHQYNGYSYVQFARKPYCYAYEREGERICIRHRGKNICLSGDTQGVPEMRALKDIDVAFVCMNLPYTMDVNEAADAVLAFRLVDAGNKGIDVRLREWYPTNL